MLTGFHIASIILELFEAQFKRKNNLPISTKRMLLPAILAITTAGCASKALFATNTSVGIDLDARTGSLSIAYNRQEGYLGPTYETGQAPPVVASLKNDGRVFNPRLSQVYATGEAAKIATSQGDPLPSLPQAELLKGQKKSMYFGTNTTTGFKLGFTPSSFVPDQLIFGFKRQEVSFIPLITPNNGSEEEVYSSTLAFYETERTAKTGGGSIPDPEFEDHSYFATGRAAEQLASMKVIRDFFRSRAVEQLLAQYDDLAEKERILGQSLMACYNTVPFARIPSVWNDAIRLQLIRDSQFKPNADAWYQSVSGNVGATEQEKKRLLFNASAGAGPSTHYEAFLMNVQGQDERVESLLRHLDFVCNVI